MAPGFDGHTFSWDFRRMWASTVLAVAIGALLAVQAVLNARVSALLGRPIHAALLSFAVGMVSLLLLAGAMGDGLPPMARLRQLPAPYWTAGALGAVYVASVILLVPKIGSATLVAASVAGQFVMALLLDHYGWLGLAARPIDARRLLGIACLGLGVWLLQKKSARSFHDREHDAPTMALGKFRRRFPQRSASRRSLPNCSIFRGPSP